MKTVKRLTWKKNSADFFEESLFKSKMGERKMKLGKRLLVLGLLASLVLAAPVFKTWATNPAPAGAVIVGPEYWGVVVINCNKNVVTLRVKRVVDCKVETQALIEDYQSFAICDNEITEEIILNQWGHGKIFGEAGVPIVTKVKNFKKQTFTDPSPAEYAGDLYSADVLIRFCTNCNQ